MIRNCIKSLNKTRLNDPKSSFSYRIQINPLIIALSGLISLLIVLFVVSLQSRRAAEKNPTHVLVEE